MCSGKFDPLFVPSAELVASLRSFFGLGDAFPWHRLAARSPHARSLLLLGEQPLRLLRRDAAAGRLRVVSSGVRLFDAYTTHTPCMHHACIHHVHVHVCIHTMHAYTRCASSMPRSSRG